MKRVIYVIVSIFLMVILSCEKDTTTTPDDNNPIQMGLDGVVQKGPFNMGSTIIVQELNDEFSPNGISFNIATEDNFGSFTLKSEVETDFIEIISDGFYFNEVTGVNTDAKLTLRALSSVSDSLKCNINILTTLAKKRIIYLINEETKTYYEAKQQAQNEILDIFSIHEADVADFEKMDISQNRISDAILLAISVVLQGSNTVSELSLIVSTIIEDIKEDGVLNDTSVKTEIYSNAKNLNLPDVRSNIETRYDDLGLSLTIPDFEEYVNDMWKIQCTITSPMNNEQFNYNDSMTVNIEDFASFINIVNAKYFLDGELLLDDNEYPFINSFKLQNLEFGNHLLKAVAQDDSTNVYADSINIIINTPDVFTLISPEINSVYTVADSIIIGISNQPDYIDITNVQYFFDDNLISEITDYPYIYTITLDSSFVSGKHFIKTIIADETGRSSRDSIEITLIDDLPNMVFVLGGEFEMGDHFNEGESDELPLHNVTLSDYYIGKYEITQTEWNLYISKSDDKNFSKNDLPIGGVTWYNCIRFCNYKSIAEGLIPCYKNSGIEDPDLWSYSESIECDWNANGYRLPTEAEWEYAARGGIHHIDNYRYSGSNVLDEVAWYQANSGTVVHPVGTKQPNQLGIYDMSGNLFEYCWDWVGSYSSTDQIDPTGPTTGEFHPLRGGCFTVVDNCRVAERYYGYAGEFRYGFRIVRTP